ncbi:uncharacterized protein LOC131617851 isoform X2 [Vicia villosa]|uniref:uncharacterized protein LOC131617767 isoform X2 n=1 Tax=Vicia villosa TaxID=3911 RepID=UPI00273B31DE|nr:uncharacterized protein LOC131617767 isoform X2 [Vicia villosa]XP_058745104.1 uncharacterized protein LOC131617851 isoform X2 [Vicia villosa]
MELTAHGCTMGLSASRTTIILLFIFLSNFSFTIATRKDIGFKFTPLCKNIVRDRYLLSDNNGYVCNALSIDSKSRCCPQTGKKFSERNNILNCTLWENYDVQFHDFSSSRKDFKSPTVVVLQFAKIKEEGKLKR